MKHVVATVDEIPPGTSKIVVVDRRSIGVYNIDGQFFGLRNRCPHQGGPLCEGKIWGELTSTGPGEFKYDPTPTTVSCPYHGWEFDIRTGRSWCEPRRLRVGAYEVGVERGAELMAQARSGQARIPGPYLAETIPISVEGDYVVVNLTS